MMDLKALKKLAAACRKAGIKKYTSPEFSFELTDDIPEAPVKKSVATINDLPMMTDTVDGSADDLTEEQLLLWSVQSGDVSTGN